MPGPAGSAWADAVAAIVRRGRGGRAPVRAAARCRLAEAAVAVSGGRLLAPGWPARSAGLINTS